MCRDSLRTGDRAFCQGCYGRGTVPGKHGRLRCEQCNGKGAVCPKCHGQRFVIARKPGREWSDLGELPCSDVIRCPACTEGNNVNEMKEAREIKRYIALSETFSDDDDRLGKASGRNE